MSPQGRVERRVLRKPAFLRLNSAIALLAILGSPPAIAQTWEGDVSNDWFESGNWATGAIPTGSGGATTVASGGSAQVRSPGAQASALFVGGPDSGLLLIAAGGSLLTQTGFLGFFDLGKVIVEGATSSWVNTNELYVGFGDAGSTLTVRDGGSVESGTVYIGGLFSNIGLFGLGQGAVMVTGPGSILAARGEFGAGGTLYVGHFGSNSHPSSLTVANGGGVVSGAGEIGFEGPGIVTLSGEGSGWSVCTFAFLTCSSGPLTVGIESLGRLHIEDGAEAFSITGVIGVEATGTVTLSGVDSAWRIAGDTLVVGQGGIGSLTVSENSVVQVNSPSNTGIVTVAQESGSIGNLNFGAEAGAAARAPGAVLAGSVMFGNGEGRVVFNHTGSDFVFSSDIGGAGDVLVESGVTTLTGANSYSGETRITGGRLNASGGAAIGDASDVVLFAAGTLGVEDSETIGELIGGGSVRLGAGATLTFGRDGAGSSTFSGFFTQDGAGGAIVKTGSGTVRMLRDHAYSGGTTIRSGAILLAGGSIEHPDAATIVGNQAGKSAALTISGGAVVSNLRGLVGETLGSTGTVTVTGTNSLWNNAADLRVGVFGGGSLRLADGGRIRVDGGAGVAHMGLQAGSTGTLMIGAAPGAAPTAPGTLQAGELRFGAGSGTLSFNHAGSNYSFAPLISGPASLDHHAGFTRLIGDNTYAGPTSIHGGTLVVEGISDQGANSYYVGRASSDDGTLIVRGALTSGLGFVGDTAGARGDVVVAGAGARWTNGSDLLVGHFGEGSMSLAGGGVVSNASGIVGARAGSRAAIMVTGAGSLWTSTTELFLGVEGEGSLAIADGGRVRVDGGAGIVHLGADDGGAGELVIGAAPGLAPAAPGFLEAGELRFGPGTGSLSFRHTGADYAFDPLLAGAGQVHVLAGRTTLTAHSPGFTGATSIAGGDLRVAGTLGGDLVMTAGRLGGTGTLLGEAEVQAGTLVGQAGQTLTLGSLNLGDDAIVSAALGAPATQALFDVTGDLALAGNLQVTSLGGFTYGSYRLFDYGTLIGVPTLTVTSLPTGFDLSGAGITAGDGHVELTVASTGLNEWRWDGADSSANGVIDGGSGTWSATGTNWTNQAGSINAPWGTQAHVAVFTGATGGTVTIDLAGGPIFVAGLSFLSDGYVLMGESLVLDGASVTVEVDAGVSATIAATLQGNADLVKQGGGTLALTGANNHAGDTLVGAGTLVGSVASLRGDLVNDGTVVFDQGSAGAFNGAITGTGAMIKRGAGALVLGAWSGLDWSIEAGLLSSSAGRFSGKVAIDEAGTLAFDETSNQTYAGSLSGLGRFLKSGSAALTLSGDSSAFEGSTAVQGGVLSVSGSLGGGVAVETGAVLGGSGTIGGAVTVDGGTLLGGGGQTLAMGSLVLDEGAVLDVSLGAPSSQAVFSVAGDLTLDGTLDVAAAAGFGAGVYRVFDYGGSLTDNGIEVVALPMGYAGQAQTAIASQINLVVSDPARPVDPLDPAEPDKPDPAPDIQFWDGTNLLADDAIAGGSGVWSAAPTNWTRTNGDVNEAWGGRIAVFQSVAGTVSVAGEAAVTGMQFAADGYRVEGDALALGGESTVIRVGDGSAAGAAFTATIASELTGAAKLVKDDLGTLILTGNNRHTGGTEVRNGTLVGDAGSIRGDLANAGTVVFDQAGEGEFAGAITGSGAMVKRGDGPLRLSGPSSLDWTVETGRLIGRTDLFSGNADIASAAVLRFEQAPSGLYTRRLSGGGGLEIAAGEGNTLRMTGYSFDFTGSTLLLSGRLQVDGLLGGTMAVLQGASLGGNGGVGTTVVQGGGAIAPGASIGTLAIGGDLAFQPGSIYEVEVDSSGTSDLIDVAGTATLSEGSVLSVAAAGRWNPSTTHTILSAAGGITGTFGEVSSNLAFLDPALVYGANAITLRLTRNDVPFADVALTRNQRATAPAVEQLGSGNAIAEAVVSLGAQGARGAFDAASGEAHASVASALMEHSRIVRDAAMARVRAANGSLDASAAPVMAYDDSGRPTSVAADAPAGFWTLAFGSWGRARSDGNAAAQDHSTSGFLIGGDGALGDTWRLGVLGGYGRHDAEIDGRRSSAQAETVHFGLYGGGQWGAIGLRGGAAYSRHDVEMQRSVGFPGFSDRLDSEYSADTRQVFGEAGYRFETRTVSLEPFAGLAYIDLNRKAFTEDGGEAALTGRSQSNDIVFSTLGLRMGTALDVGDATNLRARGALGWRHAFGDVAPVSTAAFASRGDDFTVAGAPIARNALMIKAGLDLEISGDASFGISYRGQVARNAEDHGVRASLSMRF